MSNPAGIDSATLQLSPERMETEQERDASAMNIDSTQPLSTDSSSTVLTDEMGAKKERENPW